MSQRIKFTRASEVIRRFAGILRECERQGRLVVLGRMNLEGWQNLGKFSDPRQGDLMARDTVRLCGSLRYYAMAHAHVEMAREGKASVLVERFAELLGAKQHDDKIRVSDSGYKELGRIVQSMAAWAKDHLALDLLGGKQMGLVPSRVDKGKLALNPTGSPKREEL